MSEVTVWEAVHIRYGDSNIKYINGEGPQMVKATDYAALEAEVKRWHQIACDNRDLITRIEAQRDAALAECERLRELLTEAYTAGRSRRLTVDELYRIDAALMAKPTSAAKFHIGDKVRKTKGSQWKGTVVGTYSSELTPEGYAVESSTELGSVQIYPASALEAWE